MVMTEHTEENARHLCNIAVDVLLAEGFAAEVTPAVMAGLALGIALGQRHPEWSEAYIQSLDPTPIRPVVDMRADRLVAMAPARDIELEEREGAR